MHAMCARTATTRPARRARSPAAEMPAQSSLASVRAGGVSRMSRGASAPSSPLTSFPVLSVDARMSMPYSFSRPTTRRGAKAARPQASRSMWALPNLPRQATGARMSAHGVGSLRAVLGGRGRAHGGTGVRNTPLDPSRSAADAGGRTGGRGTRQAMVQGASGPRPGPSRPTHRAPTPTPARPMGVGGLAGWQVGGAQQCVRTWFSPTWRREPA